MHLKNKIMETKTPTAKEYLAKIGYDTNSYIDGEDAFYLLKDFATLHVRAALVAASEAAEIEDYRSHAFLSKHQRVNKDSILKAYPESNIGIG